MKQLRISGGKFIHKKILCPPGIIRPAMSLMRESLFQILDNKFMFSQSLTEIDSEAEILEEHGIKFLDLFSGSGLMAIEAISRGIEFASVVEKDSLKWTTLSKNVELAKGNIQVFKCSVEKYLRINTIAFDIIYADPPFSFKQKQDLIKKIIDSKSCIKQSLIVLHAPRKDTMIEKYNSFVLSDTRVYGGSVLYFYSRS